MAHDNPIPFFDLVDGESFRPRRLRVEADATVHLRPCHLDPCALPTHERGQVGGGIEVAGKYAVLGGRLQLNRLRLFVQRQGAVLPDLGENSFQDLRGGGLDQDPRLALICAPVADINLQDFELSTQADDQVQDFGQEERIDDVTGELD